MSPCIGEDRYDFWNPCFRRCFHDWELKELNNFFKLIYSVTVQGSHERKIGVEGRD